MKKKERKRALAIFMCITMILSMTTYAMPVQIATPSNGVHVNIPENDEQTMYKETPSDAYLDEGSRASSSDADRNNTDEEQMECDECHQTGGHADTCSKYVSISQIGNKEKTVDESVIGKTGFIKKGTTVYHEAGIETGLFATWTTREKYTITIEEVKLVNDEVWYQYRCNSFLEFLSSYPWVKADDVTINSNVTEGDKEVTVGDVVVQVSGDSIPDEVSLQVTEVDEDDYHEDLDEYVEDKENLLFVYDITMVASDANAWQPEDGERVTVTLDIPELEDGQRIGILHEHGDTLSKMGIYAVENGTLTFETYGFSNFYFYITFEYGDLQVSLSGMSEMYLSELMQQLNISYGIEDVEKVEFSNPDYIEIIEEEDDWLLRSLQSFATEEKLTITFSDGVYAEIRVKDPVYYNYALDSDGEITNYTKLKTENFKIGTVTSGELTASGMTVLVGDKIFNRDDIVSLGTNGSYNSETSSKATNLLIYVRSGMAIRFAEKTLWDLTSKPDKNKGELWYWAWDGTYNYVIIKDGMEGKSVTFPVNISNTEGYGDYWCNVTLVVVGDASPTLLEEYIRSSETLKERYSIVDIPVTLYNYEGDKFNEFYDNNYEKLKNEGKNGFYFSFAGVSLGKSAVGNLKHRGWTQSDKQANGGGGHALMGIVRDTLGENKLPVMSQGQNVDLFSNLTNAILGKTVYEDVGFQFIYENDTGYYNYNSALNHAQYNSEVNEIQLYKQSLAAAETAVDTVKQHRNGGFYPFEDINKSFTNSEYVSLSDEEWEDALEGKYTPMVAEYASDIVLTNSENPASTVDLHFGLQMVGDFYLNKDKLSDKEDPLIYEFTGDDDLWVFIDDHLVLDIGGGHTHISGSFNLTTGEVTVGPHTMLSAENGGSYTNGINGERLDSPYDTTLTYDDEYLKNLATDQMHTIRIFYLERHSGVSNCRMRFNLPLVPNNSVTVRKELKTADGGAFTVTPDTEYEFAIYTAESNSDAIDETKSFESLKNAAYTVKGKNAPTGTQTTGEDGKFKLKDGQTAEFEGIDRFTNVYVVEYKPNDGYEYSKSEVSINGGTPSSYTYGGHTETQVMPLNNSISYVFTNYMQTQPLKIEKEVVGGADGLLDPDQEFTFSFVFTKDCVKDDSLDDVIKTTGTNTDGTPVSVSNPISVKNKNSDNSADADSGVIHLGGLFKLKQGESITFPRVPVNMTFTLSETKPDGIWDDPKFTPAVQLSSDGSSSSNGTAPGYCTMTDGSLTEGTLTNDSLICDFDTQTIWKIKNGTKKQDSSDYNSLENKITVTNRQRFNLVIQKTVKGEQKPDQSFMFTIASGTYSTTIVVPAENFTDDGDGNGTAEITISGLPVGTYTVTEDTEWSWRYELDKNSKLSVEVKPGITVASQTASFTNVRTDNKWFDGEAWCKNIFAGNSIPSKTEGTGVTVNPTAKQRALKPKETEYDF